MIRLLTDKVLFASGQAVVEPKAVPLLHAIGGILAHDDMTNPVRVEGNTDNVPISSAEFPSNWELSAARASAVLEMLVARRRAPNAAFRHRLRRRKPRREQRHRRTGGAETAASTSSSCVTRLLDSPLGA